MKKNPSREQLSKSLDRRVKHLMIRVLENFEDRFRDIDESRDGQIFKSDIRNAFNDVIRAQRDEIRDYEVEYKPLQLTDDSILAITQTFMRSVQKIDFGFTQNERPYVEVFGDSNSATVLNALRTELESGALIKDGNGYRLIIVGIDTIVNSVFPILDRYRLHANASARYGEWRNKVIEFYRS